MPSLLYETYEPNPTGMITKDKIDVFNMISWIIDMINEPPQKNGARYLRILIDEGRYHQLLLFATSLDT